MKRTSSIYQSLSLTTKSSSEINPEPDKKKISATFANFQQTIELSTKAISGKEQKKPTLTLPPKSPTKTTTPKFINFDSIEDFFLSVSQDSNSPSPPPPAYSKHGIAFPSNYDPEDYQPIFAKLIFHPPASYISSDSESET